MVIINRQWKTKNGSVGIAKELLWNNGLLVRLDNYYTYPYKELTFYEWGLVFEKSNLLASPTFLSKELCLQRYKDFHVLKEDNEYYYGTLLGQAAYIRLLPTKDHFQNLYYFGKHLGVFDNYNSLLNAVADKNPYIYKNTVYYKHQGNSESIYYLRDTDVYPIGIKLDYLYETDVTIYTSVKEGLNGLSAKVLHINSELRHYVTRWEKSDGEHLLIKWNK